jgi:hypothetical protein
MIKSKKEKRSYKEDIAELKAVMDVISTKVPQLVDSVLGGLYSKERAKQHGEAVAQFYKNLKSSGMDDDKALELTKEYMRGMSFKTIAHEIFSRKGKGVDKEKDVSEIGTEIADEIRRKVMEEIKKGFKK